MIKPGDRLYEDIKDVMEADSYQAEPKRDLGAPKPSRPATMYGLPGKQKTKSALTNRVREFADAPRVYKDGKAVSRKQFLLELEQFLSQYSFEA